MTLGDLVAGVGELDICNLCDSSPHVVGCPRHASYHDERFMYSRCDEPSERGPASFWVDDTFALAAADAGLDSRAALIEGIEEFMAALRRSEFQPVLKW